MPKMLQQVQRLLPWVLGSAGLMALALALITPAPAADLNRPAARAPAAPYSALKYWQGCGGGVHGSGVLALDTSTPATATTGEAFGVHLVCDAQMGHGTGSLVVGLEGNLDGMWGDLHTSGVNWSWGAGARAGVLMQPSVLFYGHGGWRRNELNTSASGNIDSWLGGAGFEYRLPTQMPFFIDTRYSYVSYEANNSLSLDHAHEFRLGVTWKFAPTYVPSVD